MVKQVTAYQISTGALFTSKDKASEFELAHNVSRVFNRAQSDETVQLVLKHRHKLFEILHTHMEETNGDTRSASPQTDPLAELDNPANARNNS